MASKTPITDALAKELGYKDAKELKKAITEKDKGSVKERLESGQGVREAVSGAFTEKTTEIKKTFTKKGMKKLGRQAYKNIFDGDDLLSAYMRGRVVKKERKELEEAGIKEGEKDLDKGESAEGSVFTKVIAKESLAFPGMARDMNVMRQNLQKLVKLWGGEAATAKEKPEEGDKEKSPQKISEKEHQKDVDFFAEQDKKESEQEAGRAEGGEKKSTAPKPEPEKKDEGGGLLDTIMSMFGTGFLNAIKSLFNPKMLMKVFSKVFVPLAIIGTLFSGIMDGFKKYQETGSFSEAIVAGLGGMLKFLTFGLFGEDTIKSLFDSISNFFKPLTDTISGIFTGIKEFFIGLFGGNVKVDDKTPAKMDEVKPSMPKGVGETPKAGEETSKAEEKTPKAGEETPKIPETKTDKETSQKTETENQKPAAAKAEEPTTKPTPVASTKEEAKTVEKISGTQLKLPPGVTYDKLTDSMVYKGIYFTANSQEDLNKMVKAIDDKSIIEFQGKDATGKDVTIKFDGATGSQTISAGKPTPSPISQAEPSDKGAVGGASGGGMDISVSGGGTAGGGGGGEVSAGGGGESKVEGGSVSSFSGGGGAPSLSGGAESGGGTLSAAGGGSDAAAATPTTPSADVGGAPTVPSGGEISASSSDVAEAQRMESAADGGTVINAPTTNNSSSNKAGNEKAKAADVYDSELATMLATA